jgi:pSer/pThr/pTyr-binding forkhead associated (FHA) protein
VFTLTFTEPDGGKPQSFPLVDEGRSLLIGREAGCDVVLRSKDVSRRHARFFLMAGQLHVEDLGSQNGVFVRGARIDKPQPLAAGAPVEIGDVKVSIKVATPALAPGVGAGAVLRATGSDKQIRLPAKAVVGRGAECDVVLDDDSVSRKHAELARDDRGVYMLRDLESANGTFLNGKPIGTQPVLVPEGAKLRFGDVELLFWRPPTGLSKAARQKILVAFLGALIIAVSAAIVLRPARQRAGSDEPEPASEASALADQAAAAIESERFDEAARLAQAAIDKDPLAPAPRKILVQARREQQSSRILGEATSKAQVGREDEALQLLAQVPPESRLFPRARIKAKDLATAVLRTRGSGCRHAPRDNPQEVAEQCARALDVKCQQGSIEGDPMLKALRAAEKRLPRRVPWSCPQQLAPLFHDEGPGVESAVDEKALAALYLDPGVRSAIAHYARGDVPLALRTLSAAATARKPGAAEAVERIKVVDGRFREGQTAMMGGALDRADALWGEAQQADAALMPAGTESFFGRQMRSTLARAHAKAGDDRLQRMQYASAYDEYLKGLSTNPRDPHLLDQLGRLEKVAEGILGSSPSCDQLSVAAHITRADPPSPAHEAAQRGLERCR